MQEVDFNKPYKSSVTGKAIKYYIHNNEVRLDIRTVGIVSDYFVSYLDYEDKWIVYKRCDVSFTTSYGNTYESIGYTPVSKEDTKTRAINVMRCLYDDYCKVIMEQRKEIVE